MNKLPIAAALLHSWTLACVLACVLASGCVDGEPPPADAGPGWGAFREFRDGSASPTGSAVPSPTSSPTPAAYPRPCADVYAQDLLPTFELEMTDAVWSALHQDFAAGEKVYRPAVFRYGDEEYADVMVRYRGNNSRCGAKIQLAIAFNKIDEDGRFHGLRRLNLDHGGCKLLNERLSLEFMRDLGIPAACANHARLVVNGEYYGLFTNIEHVNKDFLKRNFAAHDGNLYKSGRELKTNEEDDPDTSRLDDFWAATDIEAVSVMADLDQAVREWAAEAMMPAVDNYVLHGWNYYLYDHPTRGFLFLPTDQDQSMGGSSSWQLDPLGMVRADPAVFVLQDPRWRAAYLDALVHADAAYDPARLEARIRTMWAQILPSAAADAFLDVDPDEGPPARLLEHLWFRDEHVSRWLECELEGRGCEDPPPASPP